MSMESLWLYTRNGFTTGPVSTAKLARMVLDRQLTRNTIVCSVSTGLWKPISEVGEVIRIVNTAIAGNCTDDRELMLFRRFLVSEGQGSKANSFESLLPTFSNLNWQLIPWLSIVTLGLFQIYWFFRQGLRADSEIRSQRFSIFVFLVPLFTFIGIDANKQFRRVKLAGFSPTLLGILWYLCVIMCFVRVIPESVFISRLVNLAAFGLSNVPLMLSQKYINDCYERLDKKYELSSKSTFSLSKAR